MSISIIVAIAENYAIGKDNQLLWHLSDDLKRFKALTSGKTVIMGKNTYFSLPRRPLPNRTNIVITDIENEIIEGCEMAYSIQEAVSKMNKSEENFIIGGAPIYKQFIEIADKLYITKVHHSFEADTFFPEINENNWSLIKSESHLETNKKNPYPFTYLSYIRK